MPIPLGGHTILFWPTTPTLPTILSEAIVSDTGMGTDLGPDIAPTPTCIVLIPEIFTTTPTGVLTEAPLK